LRHRAPVDLSEALAAKVTKLALVRGNRRELPGARRFRRGVYCTDPGRTASFEEPVVAALMLLPAGSVAYGLTAARLWRIDGLAPVSLDEPLDSPCSAASTARACRAAGSTSSP
jgi:hypothetical protein